MSARRKRRTGTLMRRVAIAVAAFVSASALPVGLLRWVDPPTTAFMIQHRLAGRLEAGRTPEVRYEWADWSSIPPAVKLAVIAAEDQRFPHHRGFDAVEIRRALQQHREGGRLRGASTITQQTAKNLFLWSGRDPLRKALEAWFTLLIEALWSKQRILEIYLNIAQLGPDTFGVGAASWRYFDRPVVALDAEDAALMAAVLPNPSLYRLEAPSTAVLRRAAWIRAQMKRLGGVPDLDRL